VDGRVIPTFRKLSIKIRLSTKKFKQIVPETRMGIAQAAIENVVATGQRVSGCGGALASISSAFCENASKTSQSGNFACMAAHAW
jgi:hypothetical protein